MTMIVVGLAFSWLDVSESFYLSVMVSMIMFAALFALYFFLRKYKKAEKPYPIKKPSVSDIYLTVILGLVCIASFWLLQNFVVEFFVFLGYTVPGGARTEIDSAHRYLISIVAIGIVPSVVEELLFRGLILHALLPFGKWKAVLISSALFSLFHLSPAQTVYQFIFGIILALVYLKTKNMLVPILLHFVNNFTIITLAYIAGDDLAFTLGATTIIAMITLALVGTIVILNLVRATMYRRGEYPPRRRFETPELLTLGLGVAVAVVIWIIAFIGTGG